LLFIATFFSKNSPLGQLLNTLRITIVFSWYGAVIATTVVAFPLMYKTVLGSFEQVEPNIVHAARTLGASEIRIFWQILLPLAWRGVVAGTILSFARALGEFGATLMLAGSIPGQTQTIPIAIFFAAESGNMEEALIWVIMMIVIALFAINILNYYGSFLSSFQSGKNNLWSFLVGHWLLTNKGAKSAEKKIHKSGLSVNLQKKLPDFDLEVAFTTNGQPLGILGSSGSGKSMTLRCLAGLETPTWGKIILNGRVLFDSETGINLPSRHRRIGVIFQNYALFPHLTVAQNIVFGLQNISKKERLQRVRYYLQLVELEGLENRYPHQLSGGQQQRVALARALAIQPEALLLDEPLSALDTYLRNRLEQLLSEVLLNYQGVTLFVTHKLEEAYRICDNLLVLSEGKIMALGRKEDIFERPSSFCVAQVTECKNFSRTRIIDAEHIEALDWHCILKVVEPIPHLFRIEEVEKELEQSKKAREDLQEKFNCINCNSRNSSIPPSSEILEFIRETISAHRQGIFTPSLIPTANISDIECGSLVNSNVQREDESIIIPSWSLAPI
jgi:molybdate transport system permease protein